jgi:hypothetical protein
VSLRDLPATVVDRAGLSTGSPFPGRSLAAYWGTAPGKVPSGITTSALSEQSGPPVLRPRTPAGLGHGGFQLSLVASGRHYLRDGAGAEGLCDLKSDPFERVNLMDSPDGHHAVGDFRRMLLEILSENPGPAEVEAAELEPYRKRLEALVAEGSSRRVAIGP